MNRFDPGAARAKFAASKALAKKNPLQIASPSMLDGIPNTALHADSVRKAQAGDSVAATDH